MNIKIPRQVNIKMQSSTPLPLSLSLALVQVRRPKLSNFKNWFREIHPWFMPIDLPHYKIGFALRYSGQIQMNAVICKFIWLFDFPYKYAIVSKFNADHDHVKMYTWCQLMFPIDHLGRIISLVSTYKRIWIICCLTSQTPLAYSMKERFNGGVLLILISPKSLPYAFFILFFNY